MEKYIQFLEKLNQLTRETGIIVDTFGDEFYNPSLATDKTLGRHNTEDRIFISYDCIVETYVGRLGNPYDGKVVFPEDYKQD